MPRAILFDLDGTLVDTRASSWELFSETNRAFGLGVDSREAFFRAFEGNFFESLSKLCPDPAKAAAAKSHFMELLRTRYHPALIPGMVDVVRSLAPHCTLALISTNGIEAIRRILVEAGIATCFSHVFSGDVEPRKVASMRRFLSDQRYAAQRMCSPAYHEGKGGGVLEAADVVLVTDTVGDVAEAKEAGIRAIGVAWGMHSERQLLEAGAEKVALWPQELIAWLRDPDSADACATACACSSSPGAACGTHGAPALDSRLLGTRPIDASVSADPQASAGLLRRAEQLRSRHARAGPLAASEASSAARLDFDPDASRAELMQALALTVGRL